MTTHVRKLKELKLSGVHWPIARRWSGFRKSMIHVMQGSKVLCLGHEPGDYAVKVPLQDHLTICRNCNKQLRKLLS